MYVILTSVFLQSQKHNLYAGIHMVLYTMYHIPRRHVFSVVFAALLYCSVVFIMTKNKIDRMDCHLAVTFLEIVAKLMFSLAPLAYMLYTHIGSGEYSMDMFLESIK